MKFNKREIERLESVLDQLEDISVELAPGYSTSPEDIKKLREDIKESKEALKGDKTELTPGCLYHKIRTDGAFFREDCYFKIIDVEDGTVLYDFLSICIGDEYRSMTYECDRYSSTFEDAWAGIEECSDKLNYFNEMVDYILNAPKK